MYSVVVPVHDTPVDALAIVRFFESLRALEQLPAEVLVGVDADCGTDLIGIILEHWPDARILRVSRSHNWIMHLAHVYHTLITAASQNRILVTCADFELCPSVLRGFRKCTPATPVIAQYVSPRLRSQAFLGYLYRLLHRTDYVSGMFWMHRTAYDTIDPLAYATIRNGCDTWLYDQWRTADVRVLYPFRNVATTRSLHNTELPWRQFASGIWIGARRPGKLKVLRTFIRSRIMHLPLLMAGVHFALLHPDHPTVVRATGTTSNEWSYLGTDVLTGIPEAENLPRTGVGS